MRAGRDTRPCRRRAPARSSTPKQYRLFITARGIGGDKDAAKLVDESVRIFTNTTGRPLIANVDGTQTPTVLGSYGLMVNRAGMVESLANTDAPTSTTVGMSMAPSIPIISVAAVSTLKPGLAAKMPARWAPIPGDVVQALDASPTGQVPYSEFAASSPG